MLEETPGGWETKGLNESLELKHVVVGRKDEIKREGHATVTFILSLVHSHLYCTPCLHPR